MTTKLSPAILNNISLVLRGTSDGIYVSGGRDISYLATMDDMVGKLVVVAYLNSTLNRQGIYLTYLQMGGPCFTLLGFIVFSGTRGTDS